MNMNITNILSHSWLKVALVVAGVGATALVAVGADHLDAPMVAGLSKDINDLYVFENPSNPDNVVMVLTVDPLQAPQAAGTALPPFNSNVLYQIKIDTNGDAVEDQVIQARFTGPDDEESQMVHIVGPKKPAVTGVENQVLTGSVATGAVGTTVTGGSIVRAYAGLTDDPFFIDLSDLKDILAGKATGFTAPHQNALAGVNTLAIVVEVKESMLGADKVGVWATTNNKVAGTNRYAQEDRFGLPAMNTVFIPAGVKDQYNRSVPSNDAANYRQYVKDFAMKVAKKSVKEADGLAATLMPDMMPYDRTKPANFAALNGRRLSDDAVDVALSLLFKGIPTLETDKVDSNDMAFRTSFPWLAPSQKK
jgi:hypothetical protein